MAYKQAKHKEHAFKTISKDIKDHQIPSVVLLYGKEQYLVDWSIGLIVDKYVSAETKSFDFTKIDCEQFTVDALIEACETFSLFSASKVVAIKDFAYIGGQKMKNFASEDEERLIQYISEVPAETILIFTAENADKRKKIYKQIEKQGKVYQFDSLSENELTNFMIKRFKLAGKTCKSYIIKEIIGLSGYYHKETEYSLYNLENDLRKIIAHSTGGEIIAADIFAAVSGSLETNVFAMVDAISRGRKNEAYALVFQLLKTGESVYKLLALIISQFELILAAKEIRQDKLTLTEMAKTLEVHEFRLKNALVFAERYTIERLRRILMSAYETDVRIKTGLLEAGMALELFIAEV